MMKLFLLLITFSLYIHATCTQEQMQEAQNLFDQGEFEQALDACYSVEIEANMLIVKAEEEVDVKRKIAFYKEALIAISKFVDKRVLIHEQNRLNLILAELYAPINKEVSKIYYSKVTKRLESETDKSHTGFYLFILSLILSAFFLFFRKTKN